MGLYINLCESVTDDTKSIRYLIVFLIAFESIKVLLRM